MPEPRRAPYLEAVFRTIRYLVPFRPRDLGWEKNNRTRILDEQPGSYFRKLRKQFFGMEKIWIRDPGWKTFGSGIREKHPGSATLVLLLEIQICVLLYSRTDTKEYALKMIEGAGLSMSACREIALLR
jgi:hypothetical protein